MSALWCLRKKRADLRCSEGRQKNNWGLSGLTPKDRLLCMREYKKRYRGTPELLINPRGIRHEYETNSHQHDCGHEIALWPEIGQ
jgi:hypothetical protein